MPEDRNELDELAGAAFPPRESEDNMVLRAAGGLLWRDGPHGREIVVIHRSRYDEWALPKGKPKTGESLEETALREVEEETGIEAEIVAYAGATEYEVAGRPKVVDFWNMRLQSQHAFQPDEEVDRVVWLRVEEALRRLDHEEEIQLLIRSSEADRLEDV